MTRSSLAALFVLALSASAAAQDFGAQWADRISHILVDDGSPMQPSPFTLNFSAGEVYSYDSNIFLTNTGATSDSIFTTFGRAQLKYAAVNWDAEADAMVNYNAYSDATDASTDEERGFARIRAHGPTASLQLSELFRRESSPTDVVFANRVRRIVSDTIPEATFRLNDSLWFEATTDLQVVSFQDEDFQSSDNINTRSIGTMAWRTKRVGMDVLVQAGYLTIHYQDFDGPQDVYGWLGRLGIRGDLAPDLHLYAVAGITDVGTTNSSQLGRGRSMITMDAEAHLAYDIADTMVVYADYSRRPGFAGGAVAYQIVDAFSAVFEYTPREDLTLRARFEHDRIHNSEGERRSWISGTVGPEYRLIEQIHLEAHATYRRGRTPDSLGDERFSDLILSVGIIGVF